MNGFRIEISRTTLQSDAKKTSLSPQFCPIHRETDEISSGCLDAVGYRSHLAAAVTIPAEII
ncbi:hypothetical protein Q9316_04060 [Shinella zoogloeoides]|nr:hypothetical protein Q9316_04060 [Shinella zoogloeoides]